MKYSEKLNPDVKYFITSDLHFGHGNIMKFYPKQRPWKSVEGMTEALIAHWNSIVPEDGVVFHLGDFSFKGIDFTQGVIDRLNGTIIFIMGNHDKTVRNQVKSANKFDYLEVNYNKMKLVMCHYAIREWNQKHRGAIHFYGHSHGSLPGVGRSMDVGFDAVGKILPLEQAVNMMLKVTEYSIKDHH